MLFRTALAYHLAGDAANADRRWQTLASQFPREIGVVRGKDVVLAESLRQELKVTPVQTAGAASDSSYPMFGGDPSRRWSRPPRPAPARGCSASRWPSRSSRTSSRSRPAADRAAASSSTTPTATTLGVMPVVDRGELFFQDGTRVYAVSLESGVPLPGWAQTYGEPQGQYVLPNAVGPGGTRQHTLTLTDRHVLASWASPTGR